MFIRLIARVQEINEDLILQNIEPPHMEFVWAVKYIRYDTVEYFQALDKSKTILFPYEGPPIIIKENIDKFYERWIEEMKKADAKDEVIETELTLEEDDDDSEDEAQK